MRFQFVASIFFIFCFGFFAHAQPANLRKIIEDIEKNSCTVTEEGKVKICKFDYKYKNQKVEAFIFHPNTEGQFPAIMLIPGYQGIATNYFAFGSHLAKLGFASMAVSTPGFGKTELKPDFIGKNTVSAYIDGFKNLRSQTFVDKNNLGIYGYSRGAIAASLMITKLSYVKAAVLGGGIYDLKKAYDEHTNEAIKANIRAEMGLTEKAWKQRSAIFQAGKISSSVLIIHGEKDLNAPTNQAYLLCDELNRLHKEYQLQIIPEADHSLKGGDLGQRAIDFFLLKLKGKTK